MYRFLLTPRWIALHVVVLLVIPAFVFLGRWQFGRFEERSANSHDVTANLAAAPVPLESLAGQGVKEADRFRTVTATGTYDPAHALVVRRRPQDGRPGFYVLTPLKLADGRAVIVNRGWVKVGATADTPPDVPTPPGGQVTVTGRLRLGETEESSGIKERPGLPPGQVLLIDPASIGKGLPYRLLDGYVELTRQQPATDPAPAPVPEPDVGAGGGLNFAYGVQWWLFIGVAVGGWILLIRREVADRKRGEATGSEAAGSGDSAKDSAGSGAKDGPGADGGGSSGSPADPANRSESISGG
ncbi:SURF1 family protein [Nonomuraea roseoviolacea]|uniref:SURF1-like protein n=1 Tax=Nonomuraea roseoviolacea subsp. carminata TaxID=160689 RepID=A0ABT1K324_9ACTN|nr:SURF1 family protein [Nonomuraea roseoviolacea]MCP2347449.1 cytochrome oxidase assembly protein ShyY1 [Nonomuraea roseoviolacea subsp. carminata]